MELKTEIRRAGNSGAFYPTECKAVQDYIKLFSGQIDHITNSKLLNISPRAIIAPHAGYIYSGFTANAVHKTLANAKPKRIIVIGPSHHVYFEGVSAAFSRDYETPCGNIKIDTDYLERIDNKFHFIYSPSAHIREHSTETQMPFIKYYNPQAKIIELIYGRISWQEISEVVNYIISDNESAVVISSDLSHFYPLREANALDMICLNAIKHSDTTLFDQGCEACGIIGIKALIEVANRLQLKTGVIDYRTSAEASGDETSVVGYAGAVIW